MRDLILVVVVLSLLPLCVYRPWIGVLTWSWLGYMNPHRLTWGFAFEFPFAQLVALATLAGFSWHVIRGGGLRGFFAGTELKLLLLLWLVFTYTTFFAILPEEAWSELGQISKIMLMAFLTAFLIDNKEKLRYLLYTITFSFGFFGLKGGIFSLLSGGQYRIWGPAGSFIEDNNALALGLNMALPFMFFVARTEQRPWLRKLLYITFAFTVLAVIFTYSRGGFVGLVVVMFGIFLTIRMRWKVLIALLVVASFPIVVSNMPDAWLDRIGTIQSYQEDGSALSRLAAWKAAWNLALDRPITGGGFEAINDHETFLKYNPEVLDRIQEQGEAGLHISGVHSIYFELLGENGFPGLILFLVLAAHTLLSLRRLAKNDGSPDSEERVAYSRMLSASLLAYFATGTFLELVSFDFFYQIIALVVVVRALYPVHTRPTGPYLNGS